MHSSKVNHDMRICKCGRIHMIADEKIDNAIQNNKNLLLICAGCGNAMLIGADITTDYCYPDKVCYMMYSVDFSEYESRSITAEDFSESEKKKAISEIYYSQGYKVPMKSGMYATDYLYGKFSDRWYPDFWKIQRSDITVPEIMEFIREYEKNRTTVDMDRFIRETPDEMLEVISRYLIGEFDWKGTKYEKEWS